MAVSNHPALWKQPAPANSAFNDYNTFPIAQTQRHNISTHHGPVSHTQQPLVTGTSVLGIKFDKGVMIAADNLGSYGSLARFRDIQRLHPLGKHTLLGVAGDMSDYQWLKRELDGLLREEDALSLTDSHPSLSPSNIYTLLSNLFYARRSKVDPIWNAVLVGGWDDTKKESFLAYVDLLGTTYSAPTLATGFGAHLAQPLLREAYEAKAGIDGTGPLLTQEEAEKLIDDCMKVLFYRDARSINKYQVATITEEGVKISDSKSAPTEWKFAEGLRGYGAQTQ
ncbi:20S proteasome subunit beta 7 [Cryptococcus bacillisporus CA1873]|uniref:Proteasome subunit beta n=1 Tax=Cryptococcus bacillisporus CA1873 TaxID=1296111 RepID=A0ABR5BC22_CRYGA|nr:20S proteasome subunit beta 7 [Cryptococcus bacillisporus CA1873]|eukprot:KIR63809.1 20S proteasome subunit beta 7 [Cryptococcus gattii CA1873]